MLKISIIKHKKCCTTPHPTPPEKQVPQKGLVFCFWLNVSKFQKKVTRSWPCQSSSFEVGQKHGLNKTGFILKDRHKKKSLIYFLIFLLLKVVNMAGFQYHRSDNLLNDAFRYLAKGFYWEAIESFQELITRVEFKLKIVEGDQYDETLRVLGKLRRGLAEALWHINRPQNSLKLIQLCISENCHEFSEVSDLINLTVFSSTRSRALYLFPWRLWAISLSL